jgi:hypothetical protein
VFLDRPAAGRERYPLLEGGADHHGFNDGFGYRRVRFPFDDEFGPGPAFLLGFSEDVFGRPQGTQHLFSLLEVPDELSVRIEILDGKQGDRVGRVGVADAERYGQVEGGFPVAVIDVRIGGNCGFFEFK